MFQLYIARLKCIFRNKEVLFWNYMFPILLATCFFFAFNNLYKAEDFETIKIAYDNQGAAEDEFGAVLSGAEITEGKKMVDITYCDEQEAKKLLENGEITGYIIGSEKPELFIKENGMNETILKSVLDQYRQMQVTVHTIMAQNPNAVNEGLIDDIMNHNNFVENIRNQKNPDSLLIYFYALLAFTCIYAAGGGLDEVINIQADQSIRGARVNVSPINKMKLFLCNLAAAYTSQIISILLLFFYMYYGIKVKFGDNLTYLLLACLIGSLAGMTMGACIGVWVKKKAEVKEAMLTVIILGGGFLSGMMVADMKYLVALKAPLLSYINPVNLVSDAMYSLYYFDTYDRFYLNIAILCVMTVVFGVASYVGIRRKSYASI